MRCSIPSRARQPSSPCLPVRYHVRSASNDGPFSMGSVKSSASRQPRRKTKKRSRKPLFGQVEYGGQGRGRTVDLPIFRTTVIRSRLFATVLDLRQKGHTVIGERWRTLTNETEKETTRVAQPAEPTPADPCRCKLTRSFRVAARPFRVDARRPHPLPKGWSLPTCRDGSYRTSTVVSVGKDGDDHGMASLPSDVRAKQQNTHRLAVVFAVDMRTGRGRGCIPSPLSPQKRTACFPLPICATSGFLVVLAQLDRRLRCRQLCRRLTCPGLACLTAPVISSS